MGQITRFEFWEDYALINAQKLGHIAINAAYLDCILCRTSIDYLFSHVLARLALT